MRVIAAIKQFSSDRRGLAATEFALCLPLLVIIYIGAVSSYETARAARQLSHATSTVADLTSRLLDVDDNSRDALFATGTTLAGGRDAYGDFELALASVIATSNPNDQNTHEVVWSRGTSDDVIIETEDLIDLPLPTLSSGESIILVVSSATFHPTYSPFGLPKNVLIERFAIRRPRFVAEVIYEDD